MADDIALLQAELERFQGENRALSTTQEWDARRGGTREIPLSQGAVAIVDADDFATLARWKWFLKEGDVRYAIRMVGTGDDRASIRMHRQILGAPSGVLVDHINRNGLDNRRANLRLATNTQNAINTAVRRRSNTSGFRGVTWSKFASKWKAQIGFEKHNYHLGYFSSPVRAAAAYNARAVELFGDFAVLNQLESA